MHIFRKLMRKKNRAASVVFSTYDARYNDQPDSPASFDKDWFREAMQASGYPELFGFSPADVAFFANGVRPYNRELVPAIFTARLDKPQARYACSYHLL